MFFRTHMQNSSKNALNRPEQNAEGQHYFATQNGAAQFNRYTQFF